MTMPGHENPQNGVCRMAAEPNEKRMVLIKI